MFANESYKLCRLGHHLGSIFIGTDRKGRAKLSHRARLRGPIIAAIADYLQVLSSSGSIGECLHVQENSHFHVCICSTWMLSFEKDFLPQKQIYSRVNPIMDFVYFCQTFIVVPFCKMANLKMTCRLRWMVTYVKGKQLYQFHFYLFFC